MIDIDKQIEYWRRGAGEEMGTAEYLLAGGRPRQALFFAHLAVEKGLKALVCRATRELAPRHHNLVRLGELSGLELEPAVRNTLAELNAFNLEGRYPDDLGPLPAAEQAARHVRHAAEVLRWLLRQ